MKNKALYQRVKDFMILASHMDNNRTALALLKDLSNEVLEKEQEIKELRELRLYANHIGRCHAMHDVELPCTCGYDEIMKKTKH